MKLTLLKNTLSSPLGAALAICLVAAQAPAQPAPVAHWTFDGPNANDTLRDYNQATIADEVGGNSDVAFQGDTTNFTGLSFVPGQIGGAVKLSGATNVFYQADVPELANIAAVPAAGSPVPGTGISVSAWLRVDEDADAGPQRGVVVTRTAEDIRFDASGEATDTNQNYGFAWERNNGENSRIDSRVSGIAVDSAGDTITPGVWHHVALVWGIDASISTTDASHVLYIDGQQAGVSTPVGSNDQIFELIAGGTWLIGEDSCCGGREFDGAIDDVAIFAEALTASDVLDIFNDGSGATRTDVQGNVTATFDEADVNLDGNVDIDDFTAIANNLGRDNVTDRTLGDINGSRRVDLDDYQFWLDSVPSSLAEAALASIAAPEPGSALLACLVVTGCCVGGGRRRS